MKSIWKFECKVTDKLSIDMPAGAKILCVQTQGIIPRIWAEVSPHEQTVSRKFRWYGTGHDIAQEGAYIGTVQQLGIGGFALVFHLFEVES